MPKKTELKSCQCGCCDRTTRGTFAPGHDAKLVSEAARYVVGAGYGSAIPDGHWVAKFGDAATDLEERINGCRAEFTGRVGQPLAVKFDQAARNLWATAGSREAKAEARNKRAADKREAAEAKVDRLMAKLAAKPDPQADDPSTPIVLMQPAINDLIRAVREHAEQNYESDGWDQVVEAWSDEEIADAIGRARTAKTAISRVGKMAKLADDHARDIRNA